MEILIVTTIVITAIKIKRLLVKIDTSYIIA